MHHIHDYYRNGGLSSFTLLLIDGMRKKVKAWLESLAGVRIFRFPWLPHGASLAADMERWVGRGNIDTVFDVGAHHGEFAERLLRDFSTAAVHAFEPVPDSFQLLQARFCKHKRVFAHELAMGKQTERLPIHLKAGSTGCSFVDSTGAVGRTTVDVTSVDDFAESHSISRIDLLKIDTEGFELEVLQGASKLLATGSVAFVYVETELHSTDYHFVPFSELAEFLGHFGYECGGIYEQQAHWTRKRSLFFVNALFISPYLLSVDSRMNDFLKCNQLGCTALARQSKAATL